jgi:hypothetical protein
MLSILKLRLLLIPAIMMLVICGVLLMNVTAPDPTGRRYSSADPVQVADDLNLPQPGRAAEEVLSWDLGIPRNDSNDGERACICNEAGEAITPPGRCNLCVVHHPDVSMAIPDFITDSYIADSKDYRSAILSTDEQIRSFLTASDVLNIPLYIYMPHPEDGNLRVSDSTRELIEATGGAVIPYFSYAGYIDPVDRLATIGLVLAVLLILGIVMLQLRNNRTDTHNTGDDEPGKNDSVDNAVDMTDATEEFMKRVERLSRQELDKKETRSDDKPSD